MDRKEIMEKLDAVVCRPALPSDTRDVMAFTSRIWEGEDYVPDTWQAWLQDTTGAMLVAEYHGHAVGLVKLSLLAHDQWWIMGLRVDPDYQEHGVASLLHHAILDHWEEHCCGVVRLSTLSTNLPIHHLAERTGFRKILDLSSFKAGAIQGLAKDFHKVQEAEIPEVCDFACDALSNLLNLGLIDLDWEWAAIEKSLFRAAVLRGELWWWKRRQGLVMTGEETEGTGKSLAIRYVASSMDALPQLLQDCRALAARKGYDQVHWLAPLIPQAEGPLQKAGYNRSWDDSLYLYEKYSTKKDR